MSLPLRPGLENITSVDRVIEDLLVRFIINCPPEDLSSVERELFHFEEAAWFYTDFIKLINPNLPSLKIKQLSQLFIKLCPLIWKWKDIKVVEALAKFSKYKKSIPVRGAAIFNNNMNKILLVKGTESDSWSFPRGKISKDENDIDCCIREVKEEIGFDLTEYINEDKFIERNISGKNYKIFLIKNISEDIVFKPLVRNEIEKIQWMDFKKVSKSIFKNSHNQYKFYLINSMIRPLSLWVRHEKQDKNIDQLKTSAEEKLKLLLGITKEEQIDPGRDLLNLLQCAVQSNKNDDDILTNNSNIVNSIADANAHPTYGQVPLRLAGNNGLPIFNEPSNQQLPLSPTRQQGFIPQGFQPFAPFLFVNGNMPFNMMVPMGPPQNSRLPVQLQQTQPNHVPLLNPQHQGPEDIPNVNSLSKPSFVSSSNGNPSVLLNLLNSKPSETKPRVHISKNDTVEKTNNQPSDSATLLNILHQNVQNVQSTHNHGSIANHESSNSSNISLPSPSFSSPNSEKLSKIASSDDLDYTDFEDSTDSEVEEELQDLQNNEEPVNDRANQILKENTFQQGEIPHHDNKSDSVASVFNANMRSTNSFSRTTNDSVNTNLQGNQKKSDSKPKKFKILKRGEAIPVNEGTTGLDNDGQSLLDILKKPYSSVPPQTENDDIDTARKSNVESTNDELMNMLKKNSNSEQRNISGDYSPLPEQLEPNNELLNMLRVRSPKKSDISVSAIYPKNNSVFIDRSDGSPNAQDGLNGSDLLRILKKPTSFPIMQTSDSAQLLNSIKHPQLHSQESAEKRSSSTLLGQSSKQNTDIPMSNNQTTEFINNELLNMLKRNTDNRSAHANGNSNMPQTQIVNSDGAHDLLDSLKRTATLNLSSSVEPSNQFPHQPSNAMSSSQRTNTTNNELLAMLQRNSGNFSNPNSPNNIAQNNASASAQFLNILHK